MKFYGFIARNYKVDLADKMLRQVRDTTFQIYKIVIIKINFIDAVVGVAAIKSGERHSRNMDTARSY